MRIIYLHQYFNTPSMIGSTRSYEMARRLVASGHEVHIVTTWRELKQNDDWFVTEEAGIIIHWLPVPYSNHMGFSKRILAFLKFALASARKATSLPGDIVFATSTPLTIAIPGIYTSIRKKIPMVFEVRDLWPEIPIALGVLRNPMFKYLALLLEKIAYMYSSRIVALSPGMKEGICKKGYPAEKVSVIPNSADVDLFKNSSDLKSKFVSQHPELNGKQLILYTGTIGVINGLGYIIKTAKHVAQNSRNVVFVIVGNGIEEALVREEAREAGVLGKNVFMYDSVAKEMVPMALAAADLALSTVINLEPLNNNSANKFFDALASGTPICINHYGWQADVINNNNVGIVLPPDSPENAAKLLLDKINDHDWLCQAGIRARRLAEKDFNRDLLAKDLENVLRSALQ